MLIKIFMGSASNYQERDTLLKFGQGIQTWIDQQNGGSPQSDMVRIGRWADLEIGLPHALNYEYAEGYTECDVAVFFGSWKAREKNHHMTRSSVAGTSRCFVCIETPLLNRVTNTLNTQWRTGINGFLCQSATWPDYNQGLGQQRLGNLDIGGWQGWRNDPNGHILLALQLPGDASLRGVDVNEWAFNAIKEIRKHSQRPIVVRNHPLSSGRAMADHESLARQVLMHNIIGIKFSDGAMMPWKDDLQGAYCTVTYTSGLAIDSVLSGIPTVACDNGNFAWPFSSHYLEEIERLKLADSNTVNTWLQHLSQCQYSVEEMQSGVAWSSLVGPINSILEKNLKDGKKK
jgi:hypothetical protein